MSTPTMALVASVFAVAYAAYLYRKVLAAPTSTARANEIAAAIQTGAQAFLSRQYQWVGAVGVVIGILLLVLLGFWYAVGFGVGALASAAAGFIGMNVSVRANLRVAQAAHSGFGKAFGLAFEGGAVTGLLVVGAGLLSVTALVLATGDNVENTTHALIGLAFGGSLVAVSTALGWGGR